MSTRGETTTKPFYAFVNNEGGDEFGLGGSYEDSFDRIGWENMFHKLPVEQLEVLVCLYLGMKPVEIVKVLHYKNIIRYYNVSAKLRNLYREQKPRLLDYNE